LNEEMENSTYTCCWCHLSSTIHEEGLGELGGTDIADKIPT
jgi:hypothetical protein